MLAPALADSRQRLIEIREDVRLVLDPDREAHDVIASAGGSALLGRELAVRRRGRMNDEAAHVADIGEVREELERADELHARLVATLETESEDRTRPLR